MTQITFTTHAYLGSPVVKDPTTQEPFTNEEDLKEGDEVYAPFVNNYVKVTIRKRKDNTLYGEHAHYHVFLRFGEDDRKCWVAMGFVNLRALQKLFPLNPTLPVENLSLEDGQ